MLLKVLHGGLPSCIGCVSAIRPEEALQNDWTFVSVISSYGPSGSPSGEVKLITRRPKRWASIEYDPGPSRHNTSALMVAMAMYPALCRPTLQLTGMARFAASASSATTGVNRPMNKLAASRNELTISHAASSLRRPKTLSNTPHATEIRSRNKARPGRPRGNIEKSRCMIGRLRCRRTAGYPKKGGTRSALFGYGRRMLLECRDDGHWYSGHKSTDR